MIDRDQVHYVARLAKLAVTEEEVDRMSVELSRVLDYIEHIGELELDDVEPTSHVVALENVLRPDVPHQSLSKEKALENAPRVEGGGFAVPSAGS